MFSRYIVATTNTCMWYTTSCRVFARACVCLMYRNIVVVVVVHRYTHGCVSPTSADCGLVRNWASATREHGYAPIITGSDSSPWNRPPFALSETWVALKGLWDMVTAGWTADTDQTPYQGSPYCSSFATRCPKQSFTRIMILINEFSYTFSYVQNRRFIFTLPQIYNTR